VKGEKWAKRLDFNLSDRWTSPHLAYNTRERRGCVRVPPYGDEHSMASWISHEAGHMECYDENPPCRLRSKIEKVIRSDRMPSIIQAIVRKLLYLIFWRSRMREELCAHKTEIRLLQKIGMPLEAVHRGDEEADKLIPVVPWSGFIERLFKNRMQKAQDALTAAANS